MQIHRRRAWLLFVELSIGRPPFNNVDNIQSSLSLICAAGFLRVKIGSYVSHEDDHYIDLRTLADQPRSEIDPRTLHPSEVGSRERALQYT